MDLFRRLPRPRLPRATLPKLPALPPVAPTEASSIDLGVDDADLVTDPGGSGDRVPGGLKVAADYAWRILVVGVLIYVIAHILGMLAEVTVPLVVALLITALLWPGVEALVRARVPRWLAAFVGLLSVLLAIAALMTVVTTQIAGQWSQLAVQATRSFEQVLNWLANGPLHMDHDQINRQITALQDAAKSSQGKIATAVADVGTQVGHFFAGTALAIFAAFFFLYQGRSFAAQGMRVLPKGTRGRMLRAAGSGWNALVAYVRAAVIVAFVDGVGAGIGAAAVGSNLFLAIGALTFITAFVPLLGAFFAGTIATGVVLVTLGPIRAIIMLIVFIAVMEIEAHVLQPFLLGRAVSLHPLMVLYGFAVGTIVAGMAGALFTVPALAFFNAFLRTLGSDDLDVVAIASEPDPPVGAPPTDKVDAPPLGEVAQQEPGPRERDGDSPS